MGKLFLGPALHWVLLIILAGVGWLAGTDRLHVSEFNLFISTLLVVTIGVIVIVLKSSPPGRQVTRDAIEDTHGDNAPDQSS